MSSSEPVPPGYASRGEPRRGARKDDRFRTGRVRYCLPLIVKRRARFCAPAMSKALEDANSHGGTPRESGRRRRAPDRAPTRRTVLLPRCPRATGPRHPFSRLGERANSGAGRHPRQRERHGRSSAHVFFSPRPPQFQPNRLQRSRSSTIERDEPHTGRPCGCRTLPGRGPGNKYLYVVEIYGTLSERRRVIWYTGSTQQTDVFRHGGPGESVKVSRATVGPPDGTGSHFTFVSPASNKYVAFFLSATSSRPQLPRHLSARQRDDVLPPTLLPRVLSPFVFLEMDYFLSFFPVTAQTVILAWN